jgi:hypothetical protein
MRHTALKNTQPPPEKIERIRRAAAHRSDLFIQQKYKLPDGRQSTILKITDDKTGEMLDFNFLWAQQQAYDIYQEELKNGNPIRLWFLKSRRVGLTSIFAADDFVDVWSQNNRRVGIVAHNDERARRILAMCKFFHKHMPKELQLPLSKDATSGIKFAGHDSELVIGTCKEPAKIRGDGLHRAHLSEAAYYKQNFNLVMQEVSTTIAPAPRTAIIIETTGKARGSSAHAHWCASRAKETVYKAVFLRWQDDPSCIRLFGSDKEKQVIMDEIRSVEPRLEQKNRYYKLTPEQSYWAYWQFIYRCEQNFEFFTQEFPYDEEEAWTSSGSSFFGDNEITKIQPSSDYLCYSFHGRFINSMFKSFNDLEQVDKVESNSSPLHIKLWRQATPGARYVLAADVSLGETGSTFSSGYIIDIRTREMMLAYHGRIRPDEHAYVLASLGTMYNDALLAPEVNPGGGGMAILTDLQRLGYYNIYVWRFRDSVKGLQYSTKSGWWTNTTSRPLMLGELRKMFQDAANERFIDPGMFKDKALLDEMRSFHVDPESGRPEASEDAFDDRIMALAIAHRVAADEVIGGEYDIYASYEKEQQMGQGWVEHINRHAEAIFDGGDPTDIVAKLGSRSFKFNEDGLIEW